MKRAVFLPAAFSILAGACVSLPRDTGTNEVRTAVSQRTAQTVEWHEPATADDPRIRALLQDELTADRAVAVAMANSPRLQATLAELLVAREGLVRAMGLRDASVEWRLPQAFPPLPATEQDQQQLEQLAATRRLDIDIARRQVDIARQQVPLARLAALGDITVDAHYQR